MARYFVTEKASEWAGGDAQPSPQPCRYLCSTRSDSQRCGGDFRPEHGGIHYFSYNGGEK